MGLGGDCFWRVELRERIWGSEMQEFFPGDQFLVLLPLPASPFRAKFSGPYTVTLCLFELYFLISTPDGKKSERLCHVKLLTPYFSCDKAEYKTSAVLIVSEGDGIPPGEKEVVEAPADCVLQPRFTNQIQKHCVICLLSSRGN